MVNYTLLSGPTLRTRQFGQHDASQDLTNAADAQQKIAFPSQNWIIFDCLCDGLVDSTELAGEVRDRHVGQRLSHSIDHAATLTRVPRYRPAWTAELGKRGLIYRTGSFAKGTTEAHRSPRCSAKCVYSPSNLQ